MRTIWWIGYRLAMPTGFRCWGVSCWGGSISSSRYELSPLAPFPGQAERVVEDADDVRSRLWMNRAVCWEGMAELGYRLVLHSCGPSRCLPGSPIFFSCSFLSQSRTFAGTICSSSSLTLYVSTQHRPATSSSPTSPRASSLAASHRTPSSSRKTASRSST
jgi:hypothetical protein